MTTNREGWLTLFEVSRIYYRRDTGYMTTTDDIDALCRMALAALERQDAQTDGVSLNKAWVQGYDSANHDRDRPHMTLTRNPYEALAAPAPATVCGDECRFGDKVLHTCEGRCIHSKAPAPATVCGACIAEHDLHTKCHDDEHTCNLATAKENTMTEHRGCEDDYECARICNHPKTPAPACKTCGGEGEIVSRYDVCGDAGRRIVKRVTTPCPDCARGEL